ncbi:hypothetical protein ACFE04_001546 [Oxalis oulophora]
MSCCYTSLANFFLLALACSSLISAYDNGPPQDYCVAVDDPSKAVYVSGKFCKDPKYVTVDDFAFTGVDIPANTSNDLGFHTTERWITQFPGLNTQGIALARQDYAEGGMNPPHWHPRATELFQVYQGEIKAGFVLSAQNKYTSFTKILKAGEGMVFGEGLTHFAINVGKGPAVAFSGFNHENPGLIRHANSLFDANPPINSSLLARALKMKQKEVEELQMAFRAESMGNTSKHK